MQLYDFNTLRLTLLFVLSYAYPYHKKYRKLNANSKPYPSLSPTLALAAKA